MALYRYEAVAASGEVIAGEMEGASQDDVVVHLQRQGHVPIRAETTRRSLLSRALAGPTLGRRGGSRRSLVLLTQQLATLLHAGLSLDRALEIAQSIMAQSADRDCVASLLHKVRGGSSLADAMAAQEAMFPKFYLGMVRAGEAGATLDATLRHLVEFLEKSRAAAEQIKSALIYPAIVLVTGFGSVAVLFAFVIPAFRPLFAEAGPGLPAAAATMLAVADFCQSYWWAMLAALAGLAAFLAHQYRLPQSRRRWDRLVLKLPLFGEIVTKIEIARFTRTLGTLLGNGVTPLTGLAITRETIGNTAIAEALAPLAQCLKEGKGLATPLADAKVVPLLAVQLIRVGEETARLEEMLLKVAEIFEDESRRSVERLLALLVPAVTILLGIIVAAAVGSLLTAILSVYELAM
jgi:general secretion pathway protein F